MWGQKRQKFGIVNDSAFALGVHDVDILAFPAPPLARRAKSTASTPQARPFKPTPALWERGFRTSDTTPG